MLYVKITKRDSSGFSYCTYSKTKSENSKPSKRCIIMHLAISAAVSLSDSSLVEVCLHQAFQSVWQGCDIVAAALQKSVHRPRSIVRRVFSKPSRIILLASVIVLDSQPAAALQMSDEVWMLKVFVRTGCTHQSGGMPTKERLFVCLFLPRSEVLRVPGRDEPSPLWRRCQMFAVGSFSGFWDL